jgi:hypothetical protein
MLGRGCLRFRGRSAPFPRCRAPLFVQSKSVRRGGKAGRIVRMRIREPGRKTDMGHGVTPVPAAAEPGARISRGPAMAARSVHIAHENA